MPADQQEAETLVGKLDDGGVLGVHFSDAAS